jgi:5'-3' exonuclease
MKYLLIDGNNLGIRCSFANTGLKNSEGVPSGVHYGVFNSLCSLKKKFNDYQFLMVWDGKSRRRVEASLEAVKSNIIPSGYKENREKDLDKMPQELKDFYQQASYLQRAIHELGIPQVRLNDFEADDIIASYVKLLHKDNEIVAVTSDRDYYQLLRYDISLWDGMKQKMINKKDWEEENGITSFQYIDVGALMGDDGDNIHGVPGIGEKTAFKEIKKYGTWQKVLEAYKGKYQDERLKYSDLNTPNIALSGDTEIDGISMFNYLKDKRSEKDKIIYPEINFNMPYTGVLYSFDKGVLKTKASKTEIMSLLFEDRIRLAYSLKRMDEDIEGLPEINKLQFNKERILQYFNYYDITTLNNEISVFE